MLASALAASDALAMAASFFCWLKAPAATFSPRLPEEPMATVSTPALVVASWVSSELPSLTCSTPTLATAPNTKSASASAVEIASALACWLVSPDTTFTPALPLPPSRELATPALLVVPRLSTLLPRLICASDTEALDTPSRGSSGVGFGGFVWPARAPSEREAATSKAIALILCLVFMTCILVWLSFCVYYFLLLQDPDAEVVDHTVSNPGSLIQLNHPATVGERQIIDLDLTLPRPVRPCS